MFVFYNYKKSYFIFTKIKLIEPKFLLFGYNLILLFISGFICLLIYISTSMLKKKDNQNANYIFTCIGSIFIIFSGSIIPIVIKNIEYTKD